MENDLYTLALSHYQKGEYEDAFNLLKTFDVKGSASNKERVLLEACKKQISEQYYFLIVNHISQQEYHKATQLQNDFLEKYNFDERIMRITIPKVDTKIEETDEKPSVPFNLLFGIGLVVLMGVVAWWILQSNEKDNYTPTVENQTENIADKDIYEQRSNEIIRELTSKYGDKIQVEYKYPELSKYCTFGLKGEDDYNFRYLLVYDLDREILKQFDTQSLFTNNHKELFLATYSISINSQNNKLLISGNNGANSIGYTEYLLELDPSNWQIREICSGSEVIKKQDGYIANRRIMTKWGDCVAMSEFVNIDIYYNLNGNLIIPSTSGNNYQLKGLIDNKYSVTMQLSIQNNKIYGKYYYEKNGSDNYLYLYGGISESGDVALLEFNNEGQQTSNFKGRFTNDSFYGTFTNYKQIEMPFELHLGNHHSSTVTTNDTQQTTMTDRNPEFPGGMKRLSEYISSHLQYPTVSQENGVMGNVRVSYVIDEEGNVTDVEVMESIDPYLDEEAIRVISSMPKWKPGIKDGKYVKMKTSTLVKFKLQ